MNSLTVLSAAQKIALGVDGALNYALATALRTELKARQRNCRCRSVERAATAGAPKRKYLAIDDCLPIVRGTVREPPA